jgi:hypothetical protein
VKTIQQQPFSSSGTHRPTVSLFSRRRHFFFALRPDNHSHLHRSFSCHGRQRHRQICHQQEEGTASQEEERRPRFTDLKKKKKIREQIWTKQNCWLRFLIVL